MNNRPIIRIADDGRDNLSLWERCRLIVEQGIKKYGDAGGLPISGTGRARKKKSVDKATTPSKLKGALPRRAQHTNRHDDNRSTRRRSSNG